MKHSRALQSAEVDNQVAVYRHGPNLGLISYALIVMAGSGSIVWSLLDLPYIDLSRMGPPVLVGGGLLAVLIGQLGLLRQRRRERRQP